MAIPNKVVELYRRFNDKFPLPVGEQPIREHHIKFAQQCNHSFPGEGFCTKSASPSRPISKDTITQAFPVGCVGYDHTSAFSWDMVLGAGTNNPRPIYGGNAQHDIHNPPEGPQYIHQVDPINHLQDDPDPEPVPPSADRQKLIEVRDDIDDYLKSTTP